MSLKWCQFSTTARRPKVGMERQIFLETQLWLRRVDATEFVWPKEARAGHRFLLPPVEAPSQSELQWQSGTLESHVRCSACFHTGTRICFFRTTEENEDQTVFQVELVAIEKTKGRDRRLVFIRFDGCDVFEISLGAVHRVLLPKDSADSDASSRLPPFGTLDFGSVCMRVWLEPHDIPTIEANSHLAAALRHIEILRLECMVGLVDKKALEKEHEDSWKNILRYNRWVGGPNENPVTQTWKPSEMMTRGLELFTSKADKEALRMVLKNTNQKRCQATRQPPHDPTTVGGQESEVREQVEHGVEDRYPGPREYFEIMTSLIHVFSEDNASLRRLLGVSSDEQCIQHENCVTFSDDSSQCITRKWDALDDFLRASTAAAEISNKRRRMSGEGHVNTSEGEQGCIQQAAEAFQKSIVEATEARSLRVSLTSCSQHLAKLEAVAFTTLFQTNSITNASSRAQAATEPRTGPSGSLEYARTEHMYKFLLESHQSLVRHDLAVQCLPHRTDMATPSPNGSL